MSPSKSAAISTLDNGGSATVGIQESTSSALQVGFNTAVIADGDVIDFFRPVTGTDVDEYTLDLTAQVGEPIDIILDGLDFAARYRQCGF